jgi:methylated-DNA-[protein]-cysteine S-methyltransferase
MSKYITYLRSPIGRIKLTGDKNSVNSILFAFDDTEMEEENPNSVLKECKAQLSQYFSGKRNEFEVPFSQAGSEFQQRVWNELTKIPYGKTVSYNFIAESLGDKKSIRAVGAANGKNQISIIVPCHRVIGSDGSLTGYAGGMWRKKWLIKHEAEYSGVEIQLDMF